jgi:rhamnose utilization protein RhaD (predicted bifunctional aldolase and dehydrogenase)
MNTLHFHYCVSRVYYPDHAVFLGARMETALPAEGAAIAIEGAGVLVQKQAKPAIEPMLACLSQVLSRVNERDVLRPLSAEEIGQLLNWDAEKYRLSMAR